LEEWKKRGRKIQQTLQKLWKSWKNGRSCGRRKYFEFIKMFSFIFPRRLEEWKKRAEKFRRPSKNSGKVGRMEEVAEEENNLNL
jgi:hypothetical protein